MKSGFIHIILLVVTLVCVGYSHAADVSCDVDVLKPKLNTNSQSTHLTVIQVNARLKSSLERNGANNNLNAQSDQKALEETKQQQISDANNKVKKEKTQEQNTSDSDEMTAETAEKSTSFDLFNILLPSKLRNPSK